MEHSLLMTANASYSLNFLIYLQNLYLNQNKNVEKMRFPFIPTKQSFNENFETVFCDIWNEVTHRLANHEHNDLKIFIEEKALFYNKLFNNNADSLKVFNSIYKTFLIWWDSFAGRFSIERSINEISEMLYEDLADVLKKRGFERNIILNISLIYDECLLANKQATLNFVTIPIEYCFYKYKEIVVKLEECI